MKFTNIKQLLINFKGGGLINFPFKHLKEVDIDGDTDEQGESGGSPDQPIKLDTIKNYVNILYDNYNIEFDVVEEISTKEIEVEDENEEPTGEVVTSTTKIYRFVPKTAVPKVYLNPNSGSVTHNANTNSGKVTLNYSNSVYPNIVNSISKIDLNGNSLTIIQAIEYNILQVGSGNILLSAINYNFVTYEEYLQYLDFIRNNIIEEVEIPILLLGEPLGDINIVRGYNFDKGLIKSRLFLNTDNGWYSHTVSDVIEAHVEH